MVRVGIVGVGNMGSEHARSFLAGKVDRAELTALCDIDATRFAPFPDRGLALFESSDELIASGRVDALIVATPHYSHTTIGIAALEAGLHLLTEKPISVHKADCQRLIAAHRRPEQVFAAMFNQRTDPRYQEVRRMVREGELGEIQRISWIITDWFRPECYYASGSWRATWAGEGGGVLLNQCPHNLDLLQWICGMPSKVTAFLTRGKYHDIEVEDEVTAFLEFPSGATGTFITSTGEAPGANRLEIAGDLGKIVMEGEVLVVKNEVGAREFSKTSSNPFGAPKTTREALPAMGSGGQHVEVLNNFVKVILDGGELVAPAEEGIHSVELANAMIQSGLEGRTVDLPLDATAYEVLLDRLRASSRGKKTVAPSGPVDMSESWGK